MSDQRGMRLWTWERWLADVSSADTACPSLGHLSLLKLHGFSMWAWWAHARFSWQSGRCHSFLLKCSCFIMKCTTSSVLGDGLMQWKDSGLGVGFSVCFCSGINLGKPREASCPAKGHLCTSCIYGCISAISYSQPSGSPGSASTDSRTFRSKLIIKKNPESFKSKTWICCSVLATVYIAFTLYWLLFI